MDNGEFRTAYGKVSNVNRKKISKTKFVLKVIKKAVVLTASAIILLTGILGLKNYFDGKKINDVPEGQIKTTISVQVQEGDTLSGIADRFYTDTCNDVYRYVSNYEDAIQEQNNIVGRDPKLVAGTTVEVPVVVPENNTYYQRIVELEKQITDIEQNNKWVSHTVKSGELLSTLASMSSIDISETYETVNEIARKNNISTKEVLRQGDEILIVNPKLKELKMELVETQEMLVQYLSRDQIKK